MHCNIIIARGLHTRILPYMGIAGSYAVIDRIFYSAHSADHSVSRHAGWYTDWVL